MSHSHAHSISPSCIIAQDHYTKLLGAVILPGAMVVTILVGAALLRQVWNQHGEVVWLRNKTYNAVLTLTFLCYPSTSATILSTYSCDSFDDGSRRLRADYAIDVSPLPVVQQLCMRVGCHVLCAGLACRATAAGVVR